MFWEGVEEGEMVKTEMVKTLVLINWNSLKLAWFITNHYH